GCTRTGVEPMRNLRSYAVSAGSLNSMSVAPESRGKHDAAGGGRTRPSRRGILIDTDALQALEASDFAVADALAGRLQEVRPGRPDALLAQRVQNVLGGRLRRAAVRHLRLQLRKFGDARLAPLVIDEPLDHMGGNVARAIFAGQILRKQNSLGASLARIVGRDVVGE